MSAIISTDLVLSAAAAITSMLAGVLTQVLAKKRQRERALDTEKIDQIAKAFQAEDARLQALQSEAAGIAGGLSEQQFVRLREELAVRTERSVLAAREPIENLISSYHEQALSQARAQFWFSVVAATIGFAWILYSGSNIQAENFVTVSKILPGVVMDAVAYLFFRQASETRQRATELYDRLRRDKQLTESVSLVSSIDDIRVRSAVKAQIALHMSGLQPSPIDLSNFLSSHEDALPLRHRTVDRESEAGS